MKPRCISTTLAILASVGAVQCLAAQPKADGYRGIWYMNQPSGDRYRFTYGGGMATFPQQHIPIACYSPEANKTFFCFGGTSGNTPWSGKPELLHMVSYFDHKTGRVPRPTILLNRKTDDAHDNPTMALDAEGHVWIFSNSHGTARPSYIHKSTKPYSIDEFELIVTTNFSYAQPWHLGEEGFLVLHTRYLNGRKLFWMTSADGAQWSEPKPLADFGQGHYQISWPQGQRLGSALNYHPQPGGANARTNLYYLETRDHGRSWHSVDGQPLEIPLTRVDNPSLVHNYQAENLLVYLKDLQYDEAGHPVILFLTSHDYRAGPKGDPRIWRTAQWTGEYWEILPVTTSDHNYDFGSLYLEKGNLWRILAPTDPAIQPNNTGGSLIMWTSTDRGKTWRGGRRVTPNATRENNYVRRPLGVHPDFCAIWADGLGRQPSDSSLYFTNANGNPVWKLPEKMRGDFALPELAH